MDLGYNIVTVKWNMDWWHVVVCSCQHLSQHVLFIQEAFTEVNVSMFFLIYIADWEYCLFPPDYWMGDKYEALRELSEPVLSIVNPQGPTRSNCCEILFQITIMFSFKNMHVQMWFAKHRTFYIGVNVLENIEYCLLPCGSCFTNRD